MSSTARAVKTSVAEPTLSLDDFRTFMEHVNSECRGYGCGYSRRSCRFEVTNAWLRAWAGSDRARILILPKLRKKFSDKLPDYFREYSDNDEGIEDERAFKKVYGEIAEALI